jgi:Carboxypeptidase regulatory-like domain
MRASSLLRFLILTLTLACSGVAFSQGAANRYQITGTVVSSTDGTPVRHCHLTATLRTAINARARGGNRRYANNPTTDSSVDADEHGQFSIALPSAGAWILTAAARGFVTQAYDEHQQFSSAIVLTAEQPAIDLRFQLPPEVVITGTVIDEASEPIRNARLTLWTVPQRGPDIPEPIAVRATTQTDDRGMYEFANVAPGDYRITLQAQPWYAPATQRRIAPPTPDAPQLDPSLDVAYPLMWFPGVDDPALAETLSLHGGDTRQADFHLVPIPSVHLRIISPTPEQPDTRPNQIFPVVMKIGPGGHNFGFSPVTMSVNSQGQIDIGGLAPGLYQIRLQGQNSSNRASSLVDVSAGSTRTLEIGASTDIANIALHFDGVGGTQLDENSVQVQLVNTETGDVVSGADTEIAGGPPNLRQRRQPGAAEPDRTIQALPGRYEVVLRSRQDVYLTGITLPSSEVKGRIVNVHAGNSIMTLHVASGRATVSGVATLMGKPSVGAMVLLVPASLGDPNGLTILRRDQTNTDGSFEMSDVVPGQYILTVIDHGWQINWNDPSTLRSYLLHGTPVDLTPSATMKQKIEAQLP